MVFLKDNKNPGFINLKKKSKQIEEKYPHSQKSDLQIKQRDIDYGQICYETVIVYFQLIQQKIPL